MNSFTDYLYYFLIHKQNELNTRLISPEEDKKMKQLKLYDLKKKITLKNYLEIKILNHLEI